MKVEILTDKCPYIRQSNSLLDLVPFGLNAAKRLNGVELPACSACVKANNGKCDLQNRRALLADAVGLFATIFNNKKG